MRFAIICVMGLLLSACAPPQGNAPVPDITYWRPNNGMYAKAVVVQPPRR